MRFISLVAFSSVLIACPGIAHASGLYVGGELGVVIGSETDQQYVPGATIGSTGSISTEHDLGFSGSAFAGYDFGPIRLEIEASSQSADVDQLDSSFAVGGLAAGSQDASGDVSMRSIMLNGIWDIGEVGGFSFFVGGGVGNAKPEISGLATAGGTVVLDHEDDWIFAWQGFGGVRKSLTDNLDAHVRYRYFSASDAEMVGFSGRAVEADLTSHALAVGLTWNF